MFNRYGNPWRPPFEITDRGRGSGLDVGMVIAWEHAAWEVTHVSPMVEPDEHGYDMRATFHRLHGPANERENDRGDMAVKFSSRWPGVHVYRGGRVWLCSCCGDPAPCRMQVAEEQSKDAAAVFEKRLKRMGPGLCYGCGEVITKRQERMTFPGEHVDFPGRGAPTFHTRNACYGERSSYARRAGMTPEGEQLPSTDTEETR